MRAGIIQYISFEGTGNLKQVLKNKGFNITTYRAGIDSLDELNTSPPELLVVLGAPIGVYEQENYPYLNKILNIIKQRIQTEKATIGICFGCQLIAQALGSKVYPGDKKEIGWSALTIYESTPNNHFSVLSESTPVLHWHGDTFDLPSGATLLASSKLYANQAFQYGTNILAIQFHLEVEKNNLENWYLGHAHEISSTEGVTVTGLRKDGLKYVDKLQPKATTLWSNWIDSISEPPM